MLDEILRKAAAPENTAVETAMNIKNIATSNEAYISLLKALYGFQLPLEKKLSEFEMPLHKLKFNLRERHKLKLLAHDLGVLGLKDSDLATIKVCPSIPKIETLADALGVVYVMESWAQKNLMIHQMIISKSTLPKKELLKYHAGYADLTQVMWDDFVKSMSLMPDNQYEEVVASTTATLKSLSSWLASTVKA